MRTALMGDSPFFVPFCIPCALAEEGAHLYRTLISGRLFLPFIGFAEFSLVHFVLIRIFEIVDKCEWGIICS